jgi:hypothetical protein
MEMHCEVRVSTAPIVPALGNNLGLGVFARREIAAGTKFFWDMSDTRMIRLGRCSETLLRYGVRKIGYSGSPVVLLCPGAAGMQRLANAGAIGMGFRVNFAPAIAWANVRLDHAGLSEAGLCFTVLQDLKCDAELLFVRDADAR